MQRTADHPPDRLMRNGDSGCIVKLRRQIRLKGSHVLTAVETAAETMPPNRVNDRVANKETRVLWLASRSVIDDGRKNSPDKGARTLRSYQLERLVERS